MIRSVPFQTGWIEVICGSMFSGKTEELIRRITRAKLAKQRVALFKPKIDGRYAKEHVVSHDRKKIPAISVENAKQILERSRGYEVIGIDEAHFYNNSIVGICQQLADEGKRVIVSGLEQDYRGEAFESVAQLLAIAEYITKNLAICMVCGNPANRNQRLSIEKDRLVVGGHESYEARCRRCHQVDIFDNEDTAGFDLSIADA